MDIRDANAHVRRERRAAERSRRREQRLTDVLDTLLLAQPLLDSTLLLLDLLRQHGSRSDGARVRGRLRTRRRGSGDGKRTECTIETPHTKPRMRVRERVPRSLSLARESA